MSSMHGSGEAVRSWIDEAIAARAFPSAAAAVVDRDGTLFAVEVPEHGPGALLYDLASLTKMLSTAMVTLRLVDRGEMALADPITRYLEGVPRDKSGIRIVDLLRHAAGFDAYFMLFDAAPAHRRAADPIVASILDRPLAYEPGAHAVYSCIGFILLGRILERATGTRLDRLARELVFGPLGMRQTAYRPMDGATNRAAGSAAGATDALDDDAAVAPTELDPRTGRYLHGVVHDENARFLGGVSGNAGLFSTVSDCARFARLLLNGCDGFLSGELFDAMVTDWTSTLELARGLGVQRTQPGLAWAAGDELGADAFGHTGFTGTSLYVSPELGLAFVLLTNRVHFGRDIAVMPSYRADFHRVAIGEFRRDARRG